MDSAPAERGVDNPASDVGNLCRCPELVRRGVRDAKRPSQPCLLQLDRCQPVCGCGPHCVADRGRCGGSARGHEQFGADNGPVSDDELGMRTWNKKGRPWDGLSVPPQRLILLDHFNDAMAARVDQHRPIVDDGVAVFASAIFPRHFVIGHAFFGKFGSHHDITLVTV
jgi:hypothetical protein